MDAEKLFVSPAKAVAQEPKLVLPLVLSWAPQAVLLFLVSAFLAANPVLLEPRSALALVSEGELARILWASLPLLALIALAWLASGVVYAFVSLAFADLYAQAAAEKKIFLSAAFGFAKKNFVRYLSAAALLWIAAVIVVGVLGLLAFLALRFLPSIAAAFALLFLGAVAAAVIVVAAILYFVFPGVVGLGGSQGFESVDSCFYFVKGNFVEVIAAAVVVVFVSFVADAVAGGLAAIPVAGYALAQLLYLPLNAWASMVPVAVYLEKKGK